MKKSMMFLAAITMAAGVAFADSPNLSGAVWRGNIARTGEFDSPGPLRPPGLKWKVETGQPVKSSPVIVDGTVYIGSDDGNFRAIDLNTGRKKWVFRAAGPVRSSAAVFAGKVFITCPRHFYCLDAATGAEIWKLSGGFWDDSPLIVPGPMRSRDGRTLDGVVFYSQPWRNLVGVDIADGTEVWRFRDGHGPGRNGSSALVHRGRIIHFRGSQATEVVDLLTERRDYAIDGAIDSGYFTPAARDGISYSYIRGIAAFDIVANSANRDKGSHMNNYDFKWRFDPGQENGWDYQHPGISSISVDEKHVYFGHTDTYVYALDRNKGEVRWKTSTGGVNRSSPAIGNGPLLFIGSYNHNIYGINRANGQIAWQFATNGPVHSSPAVSGGILVVGSDDGAIYALE
jgi:outer membrane protein assembly factor BamB